MIIIITGASHTGKTALAQKILEKYHYPYLSIDHLKMGLVRSKYTDLTPYSEDAELTSYLWPVVREMIKTAMENGQNLVVEGCYVPSDWRGDFSEKELCQIKFLCLVFSENYILNHFDKIISFSSIIENRISDDLTLDSVLEDNAAFLTRCQKEGEKYILMDEGYDIHKAFLALE